MLIQYDIPKINKVLNDFYAATDTRIDLFDISFVPLSSSQHEMCSYCQCVQKDPVCKNACIAFDKMLLQKCKISQRSEPDYCPFGLLNIASPIMYNDTTLGYLFFGQMKTSNVFPAERLSGDTALQTEYDVLEMFSISKSQSIANLAQIVISHILTEEMLKPDSGEAVTKAVAFIKENLEKDLSIKLISQSIHVSKSVLYKKFRDRFRCTVGEYLNKERVEYAVQLLNTTPLSMEEISQKCGFSSASYFTKIFKQHMGVTPLKYKKNIPQQLPKLLRYVLSVK